MSSPVDVYVVVGGADVRAGRLFSHRRRGTESASFVYDDRYLANPDAYALDPQLCLAGGSQQTVVGLPLFRAFADSSPDRWGRNLIRRAERSRTGERTARSFGEFDLLLAVRDDLRQGAIRFREPADGQFLAGEDAGVPLLTDLPSLLTAADHVGEKTADAADLRALVRAGSSLGGARPKAHVLDGSGRLAIAKFPSPADDWNVMAWEKTALDLAELAGILVPASQLVRIDGRDVLIVDRFDRGAGGRRIGCCSALTMLEARDGEIGSYLDIASVIEEHSPAATADLEQLWRRIAFSILISNTDDHLRNHAFLHHDADAWALSPAYDLNPNPAPGPKDLSTAIDGSNTRASVATLMLVAGLFRLGRPDALRILGEVFGGTARWRSIAGRHGLTRRDAEDMAPAIEHPEQAAARELLNT